VVTSPLLGARPRTHGVLLVCGIVVFTLVVDTLIAITQGIHLGNDSLSYITGAQALLHGQPWSGRPGGWLVLRLVIAASLLASSGLAGVVAVQIVMAAVASVAQYVLARTLGGRAAGLLAVGLLVLNPDSARFHAYILTDSLYTSLLIVVVLAMSHAREAPVGRWPVISVALSMVMALLRPNGWLLPPIALAWWLGPRCAGRRRRLAVAVCLLVGGLGVLTVTSVRAVLQFERTDEYFRSGQIIADLTQPTISMPQQPALVPLPVYILDHPNESAALGVARIVAEVAHVRPMYSVRHNTLILVLLPAMYIFAAFGYARAHQQPLATLLAVVIGIHLASVTLTGADWDGRYLLFVLPLVCILAACGVTSYARTGREWQSRRWAGRL
jgi:hypothetical protein